jgi:type IV secretory pathway VirJ component
MRRRRKIGLAVFAVAVLAGMFLWRSWSRASIDDALVVLPVAADIVAPSGRDDVMAIVYSGDGGWSDLDRQLGGDFAAAGIPVAGINTFTYYWRNRSARDSARDLDQVMDRYLADWKKQRVWLVGFSFGADVLPSIVEHLSPRNRARIAQLVLLSPSADVNFEIELEGYMSSGWIASHTKTLFQWIHPVRHYDAKPLLLALNGRPPVACYYASEEGDDTVCSESGLASWIEVHEVPGDHHLGRDYHVLSRRLLGDIPAR